MNATQIKNPIQVRANSIARKHGYGAATEIIFGNEDKVVSHTRYGYRKCTTGEYVPNAYRNKFGWKNTYYQNAETTVMVKVDADKIPMAEMLMENLFRKYQEYLSINVSAEEFMRQVNDWYETIFPTTN